MIYSGEIDGKWVEIDTEKCHLIVCLPEFDLIKYDDTFANLYVLSEHFRDEVFLGPAMDFLEKHNVPKDSMLWSLGAKGGWVPGQESG